MRRKNHLILLAALWGLTFGPSVSAQAPVVDSANFSARLQSIERSLSSRSLLQMAQNIQALQREIRELRGELEVQSRDINRLQKRQRDLYLDVDKRLQVMESRTAAASAAVNPAQPPIAGNAAVTPPPAASAETPVPVPATPQINPPAIKANTTPGAPGIATAPPAPAGQSAAAAPPPATPSSAVDPASEQQAYKAAFELLKTGKFDPAANALQGFLKNYPNGRFADNAQYWLGEAYYVSRKFGPALTAFERLLVDYPNSPKRSHAMLKIGFIHDEAGRTQEAKNILTQLIQRYPQSTASGLAKKRLSRLQ